MTMDFSGLRQRKHAEPLWLGSHSSWSDELRPAKFIFIWRKPFPTLLTCAHVNLSLHEAELTWSKHNLASFPGLIKAHLTKITHLPRHNISYFTTVYSIHLIRTVIVSTSTPTNTLKLCQITQHRSQTHRDLTKFKTIAYWLIDIDQCQYLKQRSSQHKPKCNIAVNVLLTLLQTKTGGRVQPCHSWQVKR